MKIKEFTLALCKLEAKKRQVNVAQMSEVTSKTCNIFANLSLPDFCNLVWEMRRLGKANQKNKSCKGCCRR